MSLYAARQRNQCEPLSLEAHSRKKLELSDDDEGTREMEREGGEGKRIANSGKEEGGGEEEEERTSEIFG